MHTPRPVALAGDPGGAQQNEVSTHSEMSLWVEGFKRVLLGEHGMGFPDAVRAYPSGSCEGRSGCGGESGGGDTMMVLTGGG